MSAVNLDLGSLMLAPSCKCRVPYLWNARNETLYEAQEQDQSLGG